MYTFDFLWIRKYTQTFSQFLFFLNFLKMLLYNHLILEKEEFKEII